MLAWRTVTSLRQRHLQPWEARNVKDLLRQCGQFGVDHHTPTGATPLMMAARAGNLPLVEALLERGADPLLEDDFGHTVWLFALNRAIEDADFARQSIPALFAAARAACAWGCAGVAARVRGVEPALGPCGHGV